MEVSKILRKKIEKEISKLGYLKQIYKKSIINIDKSLFLCEIKMVNDIGSETMKYMQVWDNQKKEFIFTKEWFFATEIPAHNVSKIKNYSLLYFFFVGNEYFVYDAKKREFVSNLRDKTIISIKELRIVYSDMGRFIELKEEEGISVLLDTDKVEVLYTTSSECMQYIILNKYIVTYSIGFEEYSLLDFNSNNILDTLSNKSKPALIEKENYHVLQFETGFIFLKKDSDTISEYTFYLGEFEELLYDEFIVWFDHEFKDTHISIGSQNIILFNNEKEDNLTISTVPLDYEVLVKIPDTDASILVQHGALPYRILFLMDENEIIKRIVKLDL